MTFTMVVTRTAAVAVITLGLATMAYAGHSRVKQPKGWNVQYQDASCVVSTQVNDPDTNLPAWHIKMGYLVGNQLIFIFSEANTKFRSVKLPEDTKAWFTVNGERFAAMSISNQNGELVLPIENSLKLQSALRRAKSVGSEIQLPNQSKRINAGEFDLANVPAAIKWLDECNLIGVGALP